MFLRPFRIKRIPDVSPAIANPKEILLVSFK